MSWSSRRKLKVRIESRTKVLFKGVGLCHLGRDSTSRHTQLMRCVNDELSLSPDWIQQAARDQTIASRSSADPEMPAPCIASFLRGLFLVVWE